MKLETVIYDNFKRIMPQDSVKNIIFADVEDTSYEIFFYTWLANGYCKQCYELTAEGAIDENTLEEVFENIYKFLKNDKLYTSDKRNVFTFVIDNKNGVKLYTEYYDKDLGIYNIKKEWRKKFIGKIDR